MEGEQYRRYHQAHLVVLAIGQGDLQAFQEAIASGAAVNARIAPENNGLNWTPIFFACFAGRADMVLELLQNGAEINLTESQNSDTLLHMAVEGQHLDVAQVLLDWGADPLARNSNEVTPFSLILIMKDRLSVSEQLRLVRMFLDAKADPNSASRRDGMTLLHQACALGMLDPARELVWRGGANIGAKDTKHQCTPLTCAMANNHSHMAVFLIEEYCRQLRSHFGTKTLHVLLTKELKHNEGCRKHNFVASAPIGPLNVKQVYSIFERVVANEPYSIRERNGNGALPLLVACQSNAPTEIIEFLLSSYPEALFHM